MKVDKNINSSKSNWEFDKNVVKSFDSHVVNSVPFLKFPMKWLLDYQNFFEEKKHYL